MRTAVPRRPSLPLFLLFISIPVTLTSCSSTVMSRSSGEPGTVRTTAHLAVADSGNNRVLIYAYPMTAGASASVVIGQASFTRGLPNQGNAAPSAATLYTPTGLALDSSGNLWVADDHNCRVLEFQPPFTTGMSASLIIGQPEFGVPPYCGSSGFNNVIYSVGSLAFDSHGDLWVANAAAGRILEFVPPFSNGMAPSVAIGQRSLTGTAPCNGGLPGTHGPLLPATATTLCGPVGIAFDARGDLWVTDEVNLRLVEFVPPFSTGMAASLEMVGQPPIAFEPLDEESCNYTAANNFCGLDSVAFDDNGDLWVADLQYQRVLEFIPPFSNGMNANMVIGQPNFADYGPWNQGAAGEPAGLSFDKSGDLIVSGNLFTGAYEDPASSGAIVVYSPPFSSGMEPGTIITNSANCETTTSVQSVPLDANSLCDPGGIIQF